MLKVLAGLTILGGILGLCYFSLKLSFLCRDVFIIKGNVISRRPYSTQELIRYALIFIVSILLAKGGIWIILLSGRSD